MPGAFTPVRSLKHQPSPSKGLSLRRRRPPGSIIMPPWLTVRPSERQGPGSYSSMWPKTSPALRKQHFRRWLSVEQVQRRLFLPFPGGMSLRQPLSPAPATPAVLFAPVNPVAEAATQPLPESFLPDLTRRAISHLVPKILLVMAPTALTRPMLPIVGLSPRSLPWLSYLAVKGSWLE